MKSRIVAGICAASVLLAGLTWWLTRAEAPARVSADPAIVDAIKARQANFREMGAASKNIEDALRAGSAINAPIRAAASQIKSFAGQQMYWFPAGSGPESGVETAAKPEIWQRPEQFKERQQALIDAAARMSELTNEDDSAAFAQQFRVVGRACKDCHDTFRMPKD